jgi:hypothetical protein
MNHYMSNLNELVVNLRNHVTNVKKLCYTMENNLAILWKQLSYIMKTTLIFMKNNLGIMAGAT